MPFNNPVLAGEELIRSAMRSEGYVAGSEGWKVDRDGDAEFNDVTFRGTLEGTATYAAEAGAVNGTVTSMDMSAQSANYAESEGAPSSGWRIDRNGDAFFANVETRGEAEGSSAAYDSVSANNSLLYRGEELNTLINSTSQPFVAFGQYNGSEPDPTTTGEVAFLELACPMIGGRQYVFSTTLIQVTDSNNAGIAIRYTTDGSQPTLASPILRYTTVSEAARFLQIIEPIYPATGTMRFLMTLITFTGNAKALKGDAASPEISMWVEDHGTAVQNTGISNPLGSPPVSKTFRQFDIGAYAFRSFDGNGTPSPAPDNALYSYQGKVPGINSVRTGWSFFDVGLSSPLNDIIGVAPADLVYMDVYLLFPHWYFSTGGTCVLGWHTTTVVPNGNEPGGGVVDFKRQDYPGRNIGQWFSIFGPIGDRLLDGTFAGFLTGRHDLGNDLSFYGYASEIRVRAGYYK